MKRFAILLALLIAVESTHAKKLPGYVVFPNNDTLWGKLKMNGYASIFATPYNVYDEIAITDSSGRDSTYYPGDVTAFGFTDKSGNHIFRLKRHRDSTMKFQQVVVAGPEASLYYYEPPGVGSGYGSPLVYLTFEKSDGSLLFLKNYDKLETFRNKIKAFYGEDGGLGQFIDTRFKSREKIQADIRAVVLEVNKR
jgi:hypothetical protein